MTTWSPREGLPDFLEQLEPARQVLQRLGPKRVVAGVVAVIAGLWLASGLYIVNPGERGVVLLFGRIVGQTEPGLRYRLPAPIESHTVVDDARVRRGGGGVRGGRSGPPAPPRGAP